MRKVKEKIEVEKFKSLIREMFLGYPSWGYMGMIEKIINRKELHVLEYLKEDGIIKELPKKFQTEGQPIMYRLGANALPLVSAWKTEELTKSIHSLTVWLIILTVILIFLTALMTIVTVY